MIMVATVETAAARLVVTKMLPAEKIGVVAGHRYCRTTVKTKPAEPEDENTKCADGQVVTGNGFGFSAF